MEYKDVFDKTKTDGGYFGQFRKQGDRYFSMPIMDSIPGRKMIFQGKEHIMWSINNYLGLAGNDEIKKIAQETVQEWGLSGPMGSRMMSGNTHDHIQFEQELADFAQKEASILFNYGYLGVIASIQAMIEPDDIIVMDKLAHASIVDGALNAAADRKQLRIYRHNDIDHLEKVLKRVNNDRKGGVLILTEGVYGMTGDLAKLKDISLVKEKYHARLFVDDAHGIGVMGENGRGTADYWGVQDKIDLYFGTFAKAFASIGAFTASNKDAVEWIRYNGRTQVFAKSLPMVYVRALRKTLQLIINGNENRKNLFKISELLGEGLKELGFYVGDVASPIIPIFVPGKDDPTIGMSWIKFLRDKGIFVTGVMYPVIPKGLILFRVIPTASHKEDDVEVTLNAFKDLRDSQHMSLDIDKSLINKIYRRT